MPFLLFEGKCAEAMTFYQQCLGGELLIIRVEDTPMKQGFEETDQKKVIHAFLKNEAIEISATDWLDKIRRPRQGNTVGIYLNGETRSEIEQLFENLSEGAEKELIDPLRTVPFGTYGHLTDKFGIQWFFRTEK